SSVSVVICSGDSVFLEGAYQYSAGTYFDTLTGGNNCDSIITTILTFASSDSSLTAASICFGDSMLLQGAYQTTAGSYVDSFSNAGGCDSVVTTNLTVSSQLSVQLSSDTTIVTGGSVVLVASGGASYLWSTGDTGSSVTVSPTSTTTYWVNVSDSLGCLGTGQVTVTVLPAEYLVYVPNVLSLSSVNLEHTRLYVYGRGVESLELIIYDRWGKKVYESSDASATTRSDGQCCAYGIGWDGTYKETGKPLNSAVFVYKLTGLFSNGKEFIESGNITLIK
ncbi:MAG TPA: hypothetical protein EYN69_04415, partial [Flavobacteriales bacterium]|nr:hypothetical protein [Flavobacteriales bacterium]